MDPLHEHQSMLTRRQFFPADKQTSGDRMLLLGNTSDALGTKSSATLSRLSGYTSGFDSMDMTTNYCW